MNIKIKYFTNEIDKIVKIDKGDWIDLRSAQTVELKAGEFKLIPLGIAMQLPEGYEAQIRPRSGLALKNGITVLNSPGTIDSDYRGEIGVILINLSDISFVVNNGDRIAQMVICKYEKVLFNEVNVLSLTERGEGGFGHSGVK